jgi:hypothetical protein
LVPTVTILGLLVNPTNPVGTEAQSRDLQTAARTLGANGELLATYPASIGSQD